jgi:hypothetical protein
MEEGGGKRIVQDVEWRSLEPPTPVPRKSRRERLYTLFMRTGLVADAILFLYVLYQWYIGDLLFGVRVFLYYCMSAFVIGCIYGGMCMFYEHVTRNKPISKVTEIPKGRAAARGAAQLPARK